MVIFNRSALAGRLGRFVILNEKEEDFVAYAQLESKRKRKGDCLVRVGEPVDRVMILQSGWAVMKSKSKSQGNQILQTYLPGDIIGLTEIGSAHATHQVTMQTDGTVSKMSRRDFYRRLTGYPRLAALLIAIGSLELVALRYHAACMNSMDGSKNLKFFLLQLRSRLHVDHVGNGERFQVPFSQVEIGQAIGMTSIYVNKLLRSFKEAGEIEIERPYFRLLKRKKWEIETEFRDAFTDIDTSWFPSADDDELTGFRHNLRDVPHPSSVAILSEKRKSELLAN